MATIDYENPLVIKEQSSTGLLILVDANGKTISRAELPADLLKLAKNKGVLSGDLPPPTDPRIKNTQQESIPANQQSEPASVESRLVNVADPEPLTASQVEENVALTNSDEVAGAINFDRSDQETLEKYSRSEIIDVPGENFNERDVYKTRTPSSLTREVPNIPYGAEKTPIPKPNIDFFDVKGNKKGKDLRTRILVPQKYLDGLTSSLKDQGGILFPFTPTISYETSADYGVLNPMHSNFSISFYQRSKTSSISISGKFSVQNENDAKIYIATKVLLRALTRMRSGGAKSGDPDSGAPPPVCRLFAYGDLMLDNVPVAITNFRIELPDSVDYMTFKSDQPVYLGELSRVSSNTFSVPTLSTFQITLVTMYSRAEMQQFNVSSYLSGNLRAKGFI